MSYNDTPTVPFDSITSGTIRMALRRWYLVAGAVVLGLLLGFAMTSGEPRHSVSQSSRVLNLSAATSFLDQPVSQIDVAALSRRLTASIPLDAFGASTDWSITADASAGTLEFLVTSSSEDEALTSLADLVETAHDMAAQDIILSVSSTINALEAQRQLLETRMNAADADIDRLIAQGNDSIGLGPLYAERSAAATELATVNSDLVRAQSYLQLIEEDLFVDSAPEKEPESASQMSVILAGFAFGVFALLVCAAAVTLDGRVRRRVQIDHFVPAVSTIAVLPRRASNHDVLDARRAVEEFHAHVSEMSDEDISTVIVQPLTSSITDVHRQLVDEITLEGVTVSLVDDARTEPHYGASSTVVVYLFDFGKIGHNQLSASVHTALGAGNTEVAAIMMNVPRQDLAWANS